LTADSPPLVRRRRLCSELNKARHGEDLTQEQAAAALDWSVSKLIRIESGSVTISADDLDALLRHYKVKGEGRLADLAWEALPAGISLFVLVLRLVRAAAKSARTAAKSLVIRFAPCVRAKLGRGRDFPASLSAKASLLSGWVGSCWEAPTRALRRRTRRRRRTARSLAGRLEDGLMQRAMCTGSGRHVAPTGAQCRPGYGSGQAAVLCCSPAALAAI
jgi:transcriptional regulator with XRE-family HTH domain